MDHTALDCYNAKRRKAGSRSMEKNDIDPEFLAATEPYYQEVQRINKTIQPYLNSYRTLFEEELQTVVRWEYGRGGRGNARGYYYPCPITDLIVGGFERGKLLKRLKGAKPPDYRFGFDKDNHLVTVEWYEAVHSVQKEAIVYQGNISWGITFEETVFHDGTAFICPSSVRKCVYNHDRLEFMETADLIDNEINRLQIEEYTYAEAGIQTYSFLLFSPKGNFANHRVYGFVHNEEGYLTGTWSICDNGRDEDPYIYPITKKRKI